MIDTELLILIVNVIVFALSLKVYTEILKQAAQERRKREDS